MRSEKGFTIVEMITVIGVIGILSGLGLSALRIYKGNAAYSVAENTLGFARTSLEAGIIATENGPASVPLTVQVAQGDIADPLAGDLLPALLLPKNVKFQVQYNQGCNNGACMESLLQVDHCSSENYIRWMRWGDGVTVQFDNMAGADCT